MTTDTTHPDPVSDRQLTVISLVLVLGVITTVLDTTIVNVALDHLHRTFDASVAQTQWVATGYLLAFVAVIPISGWVSERFGARRAWMGAIALFLLGSLLCGVAGSLPVLIGFRVLQGIGGGLALPVTITILTRAAGRDRIGRAMIAIALPGQLAPILGPVIGGSIVDTLSWHWLFYVNVPICLAALVLAPRYLPADRGHAGHRPDLVGFSLLTPGVVALAYGLSQGAGGDGFGAPAAWAPLAGGALLVAAFVLVALRSTRPTLIDVRVFARRSFGLSSAITFVSGFSMFALMFLVPLYYQQVRHESVLHTGLLLIPQGVGTAAFLVVFGRIGRHWDGRVVVASGVAAIMIGVVPFALADGGTSIPLLLAAQLVQGVGLAATTLPVMALAFSGLSAAEAPRGSAAFSVVQRVGAPFGVAVVAVLLQHQLRGSTSPGDVAAAFGTTFWWILAFSAVPLILALFIPPADDRELAAGPRAE
jgi:EmrB/QacA subfamily drug resistance transporter